MTSSDPPSNDPFEECDDTAVFKLRASVDPVGALGSLHARLSHVDKWRQRVKGMVTLGTALASLCAGGVGYLVLTTIRNDTEIEDIGDDIQLQRASQETQAQALKQMSETLVEVSSDGRNQRRENAAAIKALGTMLSEHSNSRRAHR